MLGNSKSQRLANEQNADLIHFEVDDEESDRLMDEFIIERYFDHWTPPSKKEGPILPPTNQAKLIQLDSSK